MKRIFDIIFSFLGLLLLLPLFICISLAIYFTSKGGVFFMQTRVGKFSKDFKIFKFRSMQIGSDKKGLLTVGTKDSRITRVGMFLRKYKLDELPQLINVLIGSMSFVGPRPEVRKYVDLYSLKQESVLQVKPGITDPASLKYRNENQLLAQSTNPEKTYVDKIMPAKLKLNMEYIGKANIKTDIGIIWQTILVVMRIRN